MPDGLTGAQYELAAKFCGLDAKTLRAGDRAASTNDLAAASQTQTKPKDAAPAKPPVLAVTSKGDGTFVVTGTGFLPNANVAIFTSDDKSPRGGMMAVKADAAGAITLTTGAVCKREGPIYFEGQDFISQFSSNKATATCQAGWVPGPDPNTPSLPPDAEKQSEFEMGVYREVFDAALQGVSGGKGNGQQTAEAARDIAETAVATQRSRVADLTPQEQLISIDTYKKFFLEALQGAASGSDAPKAVVAKAHADALASMRVQHAEIERLRWKQVTLPHAMSPDCVPVHGRVPKGPKNHLLCKIHDHVVDIDSKQVIAHSVDEYNAAHAKSPS